LDKEDEDYLAVKNDQSKTTGFISKKDLLAAQQNAPFLLVKKIEKVQNWSASFNPCTINCPAF
jgi:hypothetical protein